MDYQVRTNLIWVEANKEDTTVINLINEMALCEPNGRKRFIQLTPKAWNNGPIVSSSAIIVVIMVILVVSH